MTLVAVYYNPPSTTTATTNAHNLSSKWKKGLSIISPRYIKNKKLLKSSPTILAAANEKVLCHNQADSYVKCEDLTAQEFAKMAGIKLNNIDYDTNMDEPMINQMTSISNNTFLSTKSCHHIWDIDFWQTNKPNNNDNTDSNSTISKNNNNLTVPNVIQKGRFKIVVGQDEEISQENKRNSTHLVVEWKRKRSNSTQK